MPAESARVPSLRFWRAERMLGQVELAVRAGVHPTSVQRGEMGVPLRPAIIAKLADALEVSPDALMAQAPDA